MNRSRRTGGLQREYGGILASDAGPVADTAPPFDSHRRHPRESFVQSRVVRHFHAITVAVAFVVLGAAYPSTCRIAAARPEGDPFGPMKPPPATGPGAPLRPAAPSKGPPIDATSERPVEVAAFRPWLAHEDWLCRALAASELTRRSDDDTVKILAYGVGRETDPRVLCVLLRALVGRPRDDLLVEGGIDLGDRLVPLLKHAHPTIRARALAILSVLAPVRLGDQPDAYVVWWDKGRAGLALEAGLAKQRRAAAKGPGSQLAAGETHTFAAAAMAKYADLDRIHRHGLEIVICLDSTGSMGGVIEPAKRNLVALIERLRRLAPRLRVGLVTYDDAARLRSSLTTDEKALEKDFQKVIADGGEDYEEGVDKAVAVALRQDRVAWSGKASRVIVVVGDAPPHDEDVAPMLKAVATSRADPRYESPVRVDTISTSSGPGRDADGLVPYFKALAAAGHGAALRLSETRDLAVELVVSAFGPSWREPIKTLLAEIDAFDRAGAAKR